MSFSGKIVSCGFDGLPNLFFGHTGSIILNIKLGFGITTGRFDPDVLKIAFDDKRTARAVHAENFIRFFRHSNGNYTCERRMIKIYEPPC